MFVALFSDPSGSLNCWLASLSEADIDCGNVAFSGTTNSSLSISRRSTMATMAIGLSSHWNVCSALTIRSSDGFGQYRDPLSNMDSRNTRDRIIEHVFWQYSWSDSWTWIPAIQLHVYCLDSCRHMSDKIFVKTFTLAHFGARNLR